MKTGVVIAAYGAANAEGKLGLLAFEERCRGRFPRLPLRWAYTSFRQRDRLTLQGKKCDSLPKALARMSHEQFDAVAVQPLQLVPGSEYAEVLEAVAKAPASLKCAVGAPLLAAEDRIPVFASLLAAYAESVTRGAGCGVFMAHGARHRAGALITGLASELEKLGPDFFLGAMSSPPYLKDILPKLAGRQTWLFPLLSVAGLHTFREMAGNGPDSWKTVIEKAGSPCSPVLRGLIETPVFADLWLDNLEAAHATL